MSVMEFQFTPPPDVQANFFSWGMWCPDCETVWALLRNTENQKVYRIYLGQCAAHGHCEIILGQWFYHLSPQDLIRVFGKKLLLVDLLHRMSFALRNLDTAIEEMQQVQLEGIS